MAIVTITVIPWMRATVGMWNAEAAGRPRRRHVAGPVTSVPVNTASHVPAASAKAAARVAGRDGDVPLDIPSGSPAAAHQHGRVGDEHHRQQHMTLDGDRVQVDQHRDPAEHDLAEHAGDEPDRQPRQVAPAGLANERAEHGGDHGDTDQTR